MLQELWGGNMALGGPQPRPASRSVSRVATGLTQECVGCVAAATTPPFVVFVLHVTDVRALCEFVLCDDRIELADSRNGAYARRQSAGETSGECGGAQSESRLLPLCPGLPALTLQAATVARSSVRTKYPIHSWGLSYPP